MQVLRRRFLNCSLSLLAAPALAASAPAAARHVVLLGDSILDNGAYTGGKPDVVTHLRRLLGPGSKASLLARDGATTQSIPEQLERMPRDATHLVLSVGGNDALMQRAILETHVGSVGEALMLLSDVTREFEAAYRKVVAACRAPGLALTACTIYNGNFPDAAYQRRVTAALALFNDTIIRTGIDNRLRLIDLRQVCSRPEDYANTIEPSSAGAAKIAQAIMQAIGNMESACFADT